jgi:serine/threonine-protein kinase
MDACPPPERLERLLQDALPEAEARSVEAHVADCLPCQQTLERLTDVPLPPGAPHGEARAEHDPDEPAFQQWLGRALEGEQATLRPPDWAGPQTPLYGGKSLTLPGFEVLKELGRGGMGVVYQARQLAPERLVALKFLLHAEQAPPEVLYRFRAEGAALARLRHPNIVQIHEVGTAEGAPFLVLEYLEGGSLKDHARRKPQPPREAAALVETLARAMHAAHQQGIIHRDLKPANVLLDAGRVPKITDFGIAKLLDDGASLTQSNVLVGTPEYMAPEQARGDGSAVGVAADVHALGVVLYELLTGRPPFAAESAAEALVRVVHQEAVPPRRLRPDVPRDLDTVCLKCLRKQPAERYGSALALADDLRRFLAGEPVLARPVGPLERVWRWCCRHPREALLAAAALALLLVAGGAVLWRARERERQRAETTRLVDEALEEASLLRGQALEAADGGLDRWAAAVAAGRRAEALLEQGAADEALAARVRDLLARLHEEEAAAREKAAGLEQDRRLARRLEEFYGEAAVGPDGYYDERTREAQYEQEFRRHGIDVRALDPAAAAEKVRARSVREALTVALDQWACRTEDPDLRARLRAVLREADPDPWRERFRALWPRLKTQPEEARSAFGDLARRPGVRGQPGPTLVLLGYALTQSGQEAAVVPLLREARRRYPDDFWVTHNLAVALSRQRPPDWAEAARWFTAAQTLRPNNPGVYLNLGFALRGQGLPGEAEAAFREALRLKPQYAEPHIGLGSLLHDRKRYADAAAEFRKALAINPRLAVGHAKLGLTLHMAGDVDGAIAAYRDALALAADFAKARRDLGIALARKGERGGSQATLREAEATLREAVRLRDDQPEAHYVLGEILYKRGDLAGASAAFRKAVEVQPNFAEAHYELGNVLRDGGALDGAIVAFTAAVGCREGFAQAHCNLGGVLQRRGRFAEALAHFERGHQLGSARPGWPNPSGQWVRDCRRLLEADVKLAVIQRGEARRSGSTWRRCAVTRAGTRPPRATSRRPSPAARSWPTT